MVRLGFKTIFGQDDGAAARLMATADEIIARLDLQPHPEGGHYRQTFRAPDSPRGASTAIYFLLKGDERSHWHRVDADEVWHYYAGAPLELTMAHDDGVIERVRLGNNLLAGERPQAVQGRQVLAGDRGGLAGAGRGPAAIGARP